MLAFPDSLLGAKADAAEITAFITGAFGPTVAALITRWLAHRDLKICLLWTGSRPTLVGLSVGLAAFFIATLVAPTGAIVRAPIYALHWAALLHWGTYGINYSTFLGGPVPEEPGWRGFALPRLQAHYGAFWASVILAPLWAAWHLPLFWIMPGWTSASPGQFALILLGISFLLTWAANLGRFSILIAIVLHAFFNTSSGLGNALSSNLPRRSHEMWIYTLVVFMGGFACGLAFLGKRRISGEPSGL